MRTCATGHVPTNESTPRSAARSGAVAGQRLVWQHHRIEPTHENTRRGREITLVRTLLETEELVTVLGPPGIGKSWLATAAANPSVVVRCEDFVDAESGIASVARQLGVGTPDAQGEDRLDRVVAALNALSEPLILVDGFEHPSAAGPALVAALSGKVRLLVTSRMRTQAAGEVIVELGPLSTAVDAGVSDAASLFIDCATHLRPNWDASDDIADIEELVRRLEGIPLAIELAASRVRTIGPADLLDRIEGAHNLTGAGAHREQTLSAAIDLSWEGLSAPQRAAFLALTVFHGSFDLEAAEAVVGVDHDVAVLLESLIDHSLVRALPMRDGRARFGLYALMRQYGAEKLRSDAKLAAQAVARHTAYAVANTAAGDASLRQEWLAVWHRQPGSADDAVRCALAVVLADADHGTLQTRLQMLDEIRAHEEFGSVDRELRFQTLITRCRLGTRVHELDDARADASVALGIAQELERADFVADCQDALATTLRLSGEPAEAERLYREAADTSEALDGRVYSRVALNFAGFLFEVERFDESLDWFERARERIEREADDRTLGVVYTNLGVVRQELGDWDAATSAYARAIEIHKSTNNRRFEAITHCDHGGLLLERGRPIAAAAEFDEGIAALDQLGERQHAGLARAMLAAAYALCGHLDDAARALAAANSALGAYPDSTYTAATARFAAVVDAGRALAAGEGARAVEIADTAASDQAARPSDEERLPRRILRDYANALRSDACLVASRDGGSFSIGPDTATLESRPVLARILAALLTERLATGAALSAEELISAGWPGEQIVADAAANRLRVALSTLRKRGLRPFLETTDQGYRLTGVVVVG